MIQSPTWRFILLTMMLCRLLAAQKPDPFSENIRSTDPRTAAEQLSMFRVPPGFEVQLVASEPEIAKPINMAFDGAGRLWISESREYPFPAKGERKGQDKIRVLTIDHETGRALKVETFVDGLNIPLGLYPYKDGVIAFSIPNISYYEDTDGDGKADKTKFLYGPFAQDDTHGITNSFRRGFDGWLYATHGFRNVSTIKGTDGSTLTMNSGNVYRMKVDGSRVERFCSGPVNPFGMTFDPKGNLYVGDCHSNPITLVLRGAVYPHFGNPHDGLGFGPAMMKHAHGSTAIAGCMTYEDEVFPAEYRGDFFVGNPWTCRINRDRIEWKGSSPVAIEQPDFLTCDDPWFRPVDIQLAPDGSVYVADFYNRIIGHYEVPLDHPGRDRERGRIWRIVYKGEDGGLKHAKAADLTRANLNALIKALAHPNFTLRMLAADQIADRVGVAAVDPLKKVVEAPTHPDEHAHSLWLMHRLGALDNWEWFEPAFAGEERVQVHAMRIAAEMPTWDKKVGGAVVTNLVVDNPALVRRCAAEAISVFPARVGNQLRWLLDALHEAPAEDTHLIHSVRLAIRNQLRDLQLFAHLPGRWTDEDQRAVASIALAIPSAESAAFLLKHVQKHPGDVAQYVKHIVRYAPDADQDGLVERCRSAAGEDLDQQVALFKGLHEGSAARGKGLGEPAKAWGAEVARKLLETPISSNSRRASRQQGAADIAVALGLAELSPQLEMVLRDKSYDPRARSASASALAKVAEPKVAIQALYEILINGDQAMPVRDACAQALAEMRSEESRQASLICIPVVPRSLQVKLAGGLALDVDNGVPLLLQAVREGKAPAMLLKEPAVLFCLAASKPKIPNLQQTIETLTRGLPDLDEQIQKRIDERRGAWDPRSASAERGQKVFETNCAACHAIAGQGGNVGPNLDGVAGRGADRLVEDILDPNRNVDPAFYHSIVELRSGDAVVGLERRQEGEVIIFADTTGKEVKVARGDIRRRRESRRSLMPENFHELIQGQEFNDLLAYLISKAVKSPEAP